MSRPLVVMLSSLLLPERPRPALLEMTRSSLALM